jgi:hypothetical protein
LYGVKMPGAKKAAAGRVQKPLGDPLGHQLRLLRLAQEGLKRMLRPRARLPRKGNGSVSKKRD